MSVFTFLNKGSYFLHAEGANDFTNTYQSIVIISLNKQDKFS